MSDATAGPETLYRDIFEAATDPIMVHEAETGEVFEAPLRRASCSGSTRTSTPQQYRIAIGAEDLEALAFDTFHGTW